MQQELLNSQTASCRLRNVKSQRTRLAMLVSMLDFGSTLSDSDLTTKRQDLGQASDPILKWALLFYFLFVVYGSLVPLQYVHLPIAEAIHTFQGLSFLVIGVESRADWVANVLLFVPLTWLAALLLDSSGSVWRRFLVSLLLVLSAMGLALGIEFTQLFFRRELFPSTMSWPKAWVD